MEILCDIVIKNVLALLIVGLILYSGTPTGRQIRSLVESSTRTWSLPSSQSSSLSSSSLAASELPVLSSSVWPPRSLRWLGSCTSGASLLTSSHATPSSSPSASVLTSLPTLPMGSWPGEVPGTRGCPSHWPRWAQLSSMEACQHYWPSYCCPHQNLMSVSHSLKYFFSFVFLDFTMDWSHCQ